jgi:hypothetical protein
MGNDAAVGAVSAGDTWVSAGCCWPEPLLTAEEAAALAEHIGATDPWYLCRVRQVALGAGFAPLYGVMLTNRRTGRDLPPFFHAGDYSRHMRGAPLYYGEDHLRAFDRWRTAVLEAPAAG